MHRSALTAFFIDRLRRSLIASVGLILFAFGFYLQLVADIGQAPWQALNQGLTLHLPLTFGQVSILVSVLIIAADLLLREPIGVGTILDALLVGWGCDLFLWLDPIPSGLSFPAALAALFAGMLFACFGQYVYMRAALSCGPRDALLVALGRLLPKIPIGTVNILLMLIVLVTGWLLGGSVGIGTVITLFGTGIIMNIVFHLLHFEPRSITHESLAQTLLAFQQARSAAKR